MAGAHSESELLLAINDLLATVRADEALIKQHRMRIAELKSCIESEENLVEARLQNLDDSLREIEQIKLELRQIWVEQDHQKNKSDILEAPDNEQIGRE